MATFYPLMAPAKHLDAWSKTVYRVEAEPPGSETYLHSNGKVKWGTIDMTGILSTADFESLDKAYLALNDYYVAHGHNTPVVRVGGIWQLCGVFNNGQTSAVVDDTVKSEVMEF